MKRKLLVAGAVAVFVVVCAGLYFSGYHQGLLNMKIQQVAPDKLARAMQQDHFYSDYGSSTLVVKARIASVKLQDSKLVATLQTHTAYKVECELGANAQNVRAGHNITALSEGGAARRLPNAVLLGNCVTP